MRASTLIPGFLISVILSAAVSADVVVTRLDAEKTVRGISLSIEGGQLSVQTADGKVEKISAAEVVEAVALPAPSPPIASKRPFEVVLLDGSRIRGILLAAPADHLRVQCASLAPGHNVLVLPIEELLQVRRVAGATIPGASRLVRVPDNDAAYRLDGSKITGTIESFGESGATMDRGDLGARTIAYDDLAALYVDNSAGAPQSGLLAVARMNDGSTLVLQPGFSITKGVLTGKTPAGIAIQAPASKLVALGFRGGRFEHLSDRTPQRIERTPFFPLPEGAAKGVMLDFVCPVRMDRSPDDRAITLAGRGYFKGIGVRPTTALTWDLMSGELKGEFTRFEALCGIDDEVLGAGYGRGGGTGSVVFTVELDGKEVWRSPVIRGGKPPERVSVVLGEARTLTLRVLVVPKAMMPKGREDSTELDNAVWARPLLIR